MHLGGGGLMVAKWEIKEKIDDAVRVIAYSAVKYFYPTAITKATNTPLPDAFEYLLTLVQSGVLNIKWEIRCPNLDCLQTIKTVDSLDEIIEEYIECGCGKEVLLTRDIVFPIFEINPDYKEYVKKNKSKKKKKITFY